MRWQDPGDVAEAKRNVVEPIGKAEMREARESLTNMRQERN
jgi:hypothetical protein